METTRISTRLIALKDRLAPYRGTWVVYASKPDKGFIACHQIEEDQRKPRLLEQISLRTLEEVRQFTAHLNRHGWQSSHTVL